MKHLDAVPKAWAYTKEKTMKVKEDVLLKALANIEDELAKSNDQVDGTVAIPTTTKAANGALSKVGDDEELAAKSAAALSEYVSKATMASSDDEDEDENEEEDEPANKSFSDEDDDEPAPRTRKSISQVMKSQMGGDDLVDGMPFLESLVEEVSGSEKALRKSVQGFRAEQGQYNDTLAKAMAGVCQMVLQVNSKLDTLMKQPVAQRRSYLNKSEVNQRFPQQGALGGEEFPYNKGQVLKALCDLAAMGKVNTLAITSYETSNRMPPDVQAAVESHLQRN